MSKHTPPLSIVVPVYQAAPYLDEFFASIEAQQQPGDYELMLIDDGSADDGLAHCRAYAQGRPHVTVVDQGHHGVSYARNNGIERAEGDYILFLDSDDMIEPDTLREIQELIAISGADVIIGQVKAFCEPGAERSYHEDDFDPAEIDGKTAGEVGLYLQSTGASVAIPVRYIVRRSMVLEHGLRYPEILYEDEIWSPGVIVHGSSFKLYPKYFYNYRLRGGSRSTTQRAEVLGHFQKIVELLLDMMQGKDDPNVIQFLEMRCQHLLNKINGSPFLPEAECAPVREFLQREEIKGIIARNAELVPPTYRA